MPKRDRNYLKAFLPLVLLVVAAFALVRRRGDDWEYEQDDLVTEDAPQLLHVAGRRPAARFALVAVFTTLFFAGASFTAGAGDKMARLLDEDAAALAEAEPADAEAQTAEAASAEAAPAEAAPAEAAPAAEPAASEPAAATESAPEAAPESAASEAADPENNAAAEETIEPRAAAKQSARNIVAPTSDAGSIGAKTSAPAAARRPAQSRPRRFGRRSSGS